jgi:glycosidase
VWILANALTFSDNTGRPDPKDKSLSYGTIDWDAIGEHEPDPGSILSHVKRMFRLRARHKELAIGHIEEVPTNHPQDVFAALRTSEDFEASALVVFNFSESYRDVVITLGAGQSGSLTNYLSGERLVPVNRSVCVHLYPYGFMFLKREEKEG